MNEFEVFAPRRFHSGNLCKSSASFRQSMTVSGSLVVLAEFHSPLATYSSSCLCGGKKEEDGWNWILRGAEALRSWPGCAAQAVHPPAPHKVGISVSLLRTWGSGRPVTRGGEECVSLL